METRMVYYEEPYRRELTATVTEIRSDGVVLDQTILLPRGRTGGDRGTIGHAPLLDTTKANDGTSSTTSRTPSSPSVTRWRSS